MKRTGIADQLKSCLLLLWSTIAFARFAISAQSVEELGPPQDIAFQAKSDRTEQRYVVRLPKNFDATKPHNLLIALHGHGADRWQFITDSRDECRAARDAAARHQMIYVSPDYRAKTSWMGPAAESDLLQILDELHRQYRIDDVIVCGGSMGGLSSLAFATMHPECVDGVVSMNGTANMVEYEGFAEAITQSYRGTKAEKPDEYRKRSAELLADRLKMPVGLTTGGRDTLVPPESTLRLLKLLEQQKTPVRSIHRSEGGHVTTYADATEVLTFVIHEVARPKSEPKPLLVLGAEKPATIVCLGDSVTGVYYHTGGSRAYPEMLEIGLKQIFPKAAIKVINAGISGNTTQDGLNRLDRDVLSHSPDLVTVSFGLNDMTRIPPEVFRGNLEMLIKRCRERNSQVVLCTPNSVIDTPGRPIEKLVTYCDIIRSVARESSVPLCDQYRAGRRLHDRAPWTWRLTFSDEIHPNMDGHKRMAEELCRCIAASSLSLDSITPPPVTLAKTKSLLREQKPIRVLAMPPFDKLVESALKESDPSATVEVTEWPVDAKTLVEMEQDAKARVRAFKPDLVVIAVPRNASAESDEQFVRSFSWIMNWSLSFGQREWDCIVVHPSVSDPKMIGPRDDLSRLLIKAQHLEMVDISPEEKSDAATTFAKWISARLKN